MNLEQANLFTGEGPRQENCSQGREDRGGPFREGFIVTGRRHFIKTFTTYIGGDITGEQRHLAWRLQMLSDDNPNPLTSRNWFCQLIHSRRFHLVVTGQTQNSKERLLSRVGLGKAGWGWGGIGGG